MNPQAPSRLIGIGHPFRGDDRVGLWVARRLRDRGESCFEVREHSGEAAGLMALFEGRSRVLLVDAVSSGKAPGAILRFDAALGPLPAGCFGASTHHLGVAEAIEWARALGRLPRTLLVYGIEGADFRPGENLSEPVREAGETLLREILSGQVWVREEKDNEGGSR